MGEAFGKALGGGEFNAAVWFCEASGGKEARGLKGGMGFAAAPFVDGKVVWLCDWAWF